MSPLVNSSSNVWMNLSPAASPNTFSLSLPLLSLEVQQLPSAPPHFSRRSDTSLSSLSRRSRRAAKSASHPQDPEPEPEGTSLILWVRIRGEPGARSTSLPGKHRREKLSLSQEDGDDVSSGFYLLDSGRMNLPERRIPQKSPPAETERHESSYCPLNETSSRFRFTVTRLTLMESCWASLGDL